MISVVLVLVGDSIDDRFYRVNSAAEDKAIDCLWFEPIGLGPDFQSMCLDGIVTFW